MTLSHPIRAQDPVILISARLERAVVRFRVQSAHNVLDEAMASSPPDVVARDLVLPLFEQLEQEGDPGVIRFAASLFELRLLGQANGWDRIDGPLVILACAPREERTLGVITLGLALAARHCRVSYLGAMTPARALRGAVREQDAALAVLSAERDDLIEEERRLLRPLDLRLLGAASAALADTIGGSPITVDGDVLAELAHRRSSRADDAASPRRR